MTLKMHGHSQVTPPIWLVFFISAVVLSILFEFDEIGTQACFGGAVGSK